MKILLIDDEPDQCREYRECAQYMPYSVDLTIAKGCEQGISLIQSFKPDVILLDLEFHKSDGDGMLLLDRLKKMELGELPYIIIITMNESIRVHRIARRCGADYIFTKTKPDYSPYLIFEFAHNYFIHQANFPKEPAKENDLETNIALEMGKVGITSGMSGKNYIIEAIKIILKLYSNKLKSCDINLGTHVYPVIAKIYKKSDKSVEQGIRNAIKKAWLIADVDELAEHYAETVNLHTGFPENRDFIFFYAEKFRRG